MDPMTYATQQDMIERFGAEELIQLTDRVNMPPSTIDQDVLGRALSDADALIDTYLIGRYDLPFPATPAALVGYSADIALFKLYGNRATVGGEIERNFKFAVSWLTSVANGTVKLEVLSEPAPQSGGSQVRFTSSDRALSRDSLRGL